jgi:hypothetical protein
VCRSLFVEICDRAFEAESLLVRAQAEAVDGEIRVWMHGGRLICRRGSSESLRLLLSGAVRFAPYISMTQPPIASSFDGAAVVRPRSQVLWRNEAASRAA